MNKMELTKTKIKGLYLTNEGKAYHKTAKREINPTLSGKVRFNGKMYVLKDLMLEIAQKPIKAKQPIKKAVPIRELQKQGFKKTQISGLYVSKFGTAYNTASNRLLTITTNGNVIINGKGYNFAKLILETFCKIENRSGQIVFKNGNNKDFSFENLEYKTTIKQNAPKETDLIQCIRFYFEVEKNFNSQSIFFKTHLKSIVVKRSFLNLFEFNELIVFIEWLETFSQSKAQISKNKGISVRNGNNLINKYLSILINDCLQDYENGLLKEFEFLPKPPTKTEILIKANATLKSYGSNVKIKLKNTNKNNLKEVLKWKNQNKV